MKFCEIRVPRGLWVLGRRAVSPPRPPPRHGDGDGLGQGHQPHGGTRTAAPLPREQRLQRTA